jgi:hypothetical protein
MRSVVFLKMMLILTLTGLTASTILARTQQVLPEDLQPPPPDHLQIITTQDGSRTFGRIVSQDGESIKFATEMGELTIPLQNIRSIEVIPETAVQDGHYWFPNPNVTRLYFAPSGRTLPKGEGYFADYYFFFPTVVYGMTDRFTLGGGCSLFPGAALDEQLWYVTPKLGLSSGDRFNSSVGTILIGVPDWGDNSDGTTLAGVLYGVGTWGKPDASLTFGLGYGFVDDELADHPMIMLGGEKRAWRRIAFVSENWWMPGIDFPLISYGLRFFGEKISVDFAFLNSLEEPIFPGIPYLDFTVKF